MAFFQARQNTAIIKYLKLREDNQIWRSVRGKEQIHFSTIIQKEAANSKKIQIYLQQWDYRVQRTGKRMVITYEETVKNPFQPFGLEITAKYARYQKMGLRKRRKEAKMKSTETPPEC